MKKLKDIAMAVLFWVGDAFVWAIALLWPITVQRHKQVRDYILRKGVCNLERRTVPWALSANWFTFKPQAYLEQTLSSAITPLSFDFADVSNGRE
jgi:hypothetical protein